MRPNVVILDVCNYIMKCLDQNNNSKLFLHLSSVQEGAEISYPDPVTTKLQTITFFFFFNFIEGLLVEPRSFQVCLNFILDRYSTRNYIYVTLSNLLTYESECCFFAGILGCHLWVLFTETRVMKYLDWFGVKWRSAETIHSLCFALVKEQGVGFLSASNSFVMRDGTVPHNLTILYLARYFPKVVLEIIYSISLHFIHWSGKKMQKYVSPNQNFIKFKITFSNQLPYILLQYWQWSALQFIYSNCLKWCI